MASDGGMRIPLDPLRKAIITTVVKSKQQIPHYYLNLDIGMKEVMKARDQIISAGSIKISPLSFVIRATAEALGQYSLLNSQLHLENQEIVCSPEINIGFIVALKKSGIIIPVIRNACEKDLRTILEETKRLQERARKQCLSVKEYTGGTFTISNLGMAGIDSFAAVINPPEVAILAIGRVAQRTVVRNGKISVCPMMAVTLSVDHRVVDGLVGVSFLKEIRSRLENLDWLESEISQFFGKNS